MRRAAVLVLLPLLAACATASPGTAGSSPAAAPSTAAPSTPSTQTTPAPPDGLPDEAFNVTAPMITAEAGPALLEQPLCRPTDVTAAAATRPVTGGVDGVVRMDGKDCSLPLLGPSALLGADGNPLAIRLAKDTVTVNPGNNQRPDLPFGAGHGLWGFSWLGSWCGPKPAYVVVPLGTSPNSDLKVPLTGAVPACKGQSDSVFEPGNAGSDASWGTDEAVQLAPAGWAGLRASLTGEAAGMALQLTNVTDSDIALRPCPDYAFVTSYAFVGGDGSSTSTETLPCEQQSPTIPAHGSATYTIPGPDLSGLGSGTPKQGSKVVAQVGIAGIATATLSQNP